MKPPYEITSKILEFVSLISERIGENKAARFLKPTTELRKRNRIKTIQFSLEVEGNTLTVEQITDLIKNERVLALKKDIKNTIKYVPNWIFLMQKTSIRYVQLINFS